MSLKKKTTSYNQVGYHWQAQSLHNPCLAVLNLLDALWTLKAFLAEAKTTSSKKKSRGCTIHFFGSHVLWTLPEPRWHLL